MRPIFESLVKLSEKEELLGEVKKLIPKHERPKVVAVIAKRESGKSYLLRHLIEDGHFPAIIIDKNFQTAWNDISVLAKKTEQLHTWDRKGGIWRMRGEKIVQRLTQMFEHYNETNNVENRICVIMEDCGEYTSTRQQTILLKGLCAAVRHANVHIFLVFHTLDMINTQLKAELDGIVLFKTNDSQDFFYRRRHFRNEEELKDRFKDLCKPSTHKHQHYVINFD
jgi:hypothetical protein